MEFDWSEQSLNDFDDLRTLLRECRSIDSGNLILDRLKTIIALSENLQRSRWSEPENSRSLFNQLDLAFSIELQRRAEARKDTNPRKDTPDDPHDN